MTVDDQVAGIGPVLCADVGPVEQVGRVNPKGRRPALPYRDPVGQVGPGTPIGPA